VRGCVVRIDEKTLAAIRRMAGAGATSEFISERFRIPTEQVDCVTGRHVDGIPSVFQPRSDGKTYPVDPSVVANMADSAVIGGGTWNAGVVTLSDFQGCPWNRRDRELLPVEDDYSEESYP
jgi:hypothetical protein